MRDTTTAGGRWTAALLAPSTFWFVALLILPMLVILVFSFGERAPAGGYQAGFTLANYLTLGARWTAFKNTLVLAPIGTLICLLAAYPLAYFLAVKTSRQTKMLLLVLVIVPFWTSSLLRRISISEFTISVLADTGKVSSRCSPAPICTSARLGRIITLALVL